ncbi:retinoblastoma-associated protein-like [Tubulanus polymorphus]|uniref:retinoblastoma-associated protein-like n=1 Tax=Tubulanus polymorphus TaxID=672921 RepID=UPI003DA35999
MEPHKNVVVAAGNASPSAADLRRVGSDVSDHTRKIANGYYDDVKASDELRIRDEQDERCCYVSCLYVALVDARYPYGLSDPQLFNGSIETIAPPPSAAVDQLLKTAEVSFKSFFEMLQSLRHHFPLSDAVKQKATEMQRKYCISAALNSKLNRMCQEMFLSEADIEKINRDIWTLFVCAKGNLRQANQEIVSGFHLLLCVIEQIVRKIPSFQLQAPYDSLVRVVNTVAATDSCDVILQQLCTTYDADIGDVRLLRTSFWTSFKTRLLKPGGSINIDEIKKIYVTECYEKEGDFNELEIFRLPTASEENQQPSRNQCETETADEEEADAHVVPETPVRSALSSVSRLKKLVGDYSADSCSDCRKLRSCSQVEADAISRRVDEWQTTFVENYSATLTGDRSRADGRFNTARALTFRVLDVLLADSNSPNERDVILNNRMFLKSLLACVVEVVLSTYSQRSSTLMSPGNNCDLLAFPWILRVFELKAYDFYKIIGQFIKAEPELDPERAKHLLQLEERILEYYVWLDDSPVWSVIKNTLDPTENAANSDSRNRLESTDEMEIPEKQTDEESSSVQCCHHPVNAKLSSAKQPEPSVIIKEISHSLNYFYNKVGKVAYSRLQTLAAKLDISSNLSMKIWRCVENVIVQRSDLLRNRHLDQIVLCAVYGVCKISDEERKFKTIVNVYKDVPRASSKVYRNVLIDDAVYDSIITFYNRVFVASMRGYLSRLLQQRDTSEENSPVVYNNMESQTYSLSGQKNFYISPLRQKAAAASVGGGDEGDFKTPLTPSRMTPRTRKLYSFGERIGPSADVLRSINETMGTIRRIQLHDRTPRKSHKRLKFDDEPSNSSDLQADGFCVTSWPVNLNKVPPGGDQENK